VAVTLAAGRIVALAFSQDGPNLLWTNPELAGHTESQSGAQRADWRTRWRQASGFRPSCVSLAGKPTARGLSNYHVPSVTDPGRYAYIDEAPDKVALAAKGWLPVQGSSDDTWILRLYAKFAWPIPLFP